MAAIDILLKPEECVMLLVDFQAGLGFRHWRRLRRQRLHTSRGGSSRAGIPQEAVSSLSFGNGSRVRPRDDSSRMMASKKLNGAK